MANDAIKKMSIRVFDEEESAFVDDERDIGIEAQNAIVSFDEDGEIIEDINDPEVTINSTKSVAKVLKDESNKTIPIENGGTGQTTAAAARNALGLGNTTGALPVANGGTGKTSITSGTVLVGNGTGTPTERTIDTTSGGTANSNALITSGAVKSKVTELETSITDLDSDIKRYKLKSKTKVVYPDHNGRISVLLSFGFDDGISRIPLFVLANNSYDHNGSYFFSPIYWCKENIDNVPGKLAATLYNSAGNNPTIVPSTSVLATLYYVSEI